MLVAGHWSLDAGFWSLVIGSWSLVTGYWLQVAGHRMPDIRGRIIDFLIGNFSFRLKPLALEP
jgi:hypothetical protein